MTGQSKSGSLLAAVVLLVVGSGTVGLLTAAQPPAGPTTAPTTGPSARKPKAFAPIDDARLHNAHAVLPGKIISGAQPDDDAAFKALSELGVKTVISVDGAAPDLELARKYGMKYIHLPIGYDTVPDDQGRSIAKALVEFAPNGPIYVHCHHGKHRSAAALAVGCVEAGLLKPEQAESVLETFGTGLNYNGLWKSAREAKPVDANELAALKVDFVEVARVNDAAAHMVKVDQHWDHLKQIKAAGWKSPADHPDLSPAHEALQLQEHFHESTRLADFADRPADYQKMLRASDADAKALQAALAASPADVQAAEKAFARLAASCTSCHKAYRD